MALYVGLRREDRLAGLMVLSGYLVLPETLEAEGRSANASTPLLACHGRHDEVVPWERGKAAYGRVGGGRESEWHDYPMGHELCREQLVHIKGWLTRVLA